MRSLKSAFGALVFAFFLPLAASSHDLNPETDAKPDTEDEKKPRIDKSKTEDFEFSNRIVRVTGPINREMAESLIRKLRYLDEKNPENKDITLIINSGGGEIGAGLAIFDTIMDLKSDVRTICEGSAASMGAFLLSTGTPGKRISLPNCTIMIHQPSKNLGDDTAANHMAHAQELQRKKHLLAGIIARFSLLTKEEIMKMEDIDRFMSPEEALRYGFIDEIAVTRRSLPQPRQTPP